MNLPRATHGGELAIGELSLACYVLNDGMRVLRGEGLLRGFGVSRRTRTKGIDENHPPAFLTQKNLQPFISEQLREDSAPVHFYTKDGDRAFGYRAQVLPGMCNTYLSARDAGKLRKTQHAMAQLSYHLVRELATRGVIALVDVASNYKEMCHSLAAEGLLARYMKPFAARWSKRFPDEFYQEIYRLKGWEWPGMGVNRLPITGHITNEIVYAAYR